MFRYMLFALTSIFGFSMCAEARPPAPLTTLGDAKLVLDELEELPKKGIPKALMADAEAVVIVPKTVKAGFVFGGRVGHGVAVLKEKDGSWGDIRFVNFGGASVGFQVGVQVTDVVLVFKSRKGLDRILDGKAKLTLGADASIAAGPIGRDARIATDGKFQSEIWSYSRSKGVFLGISLDGAVLKSDPNTNNEFLKDSRVETRFAAETLKLKISMLAPEKVPALPPAVVPYTPGPSQPGLPPAIVPSDLPPATVPSIPGSPDTMPPLPRTPPISVKPYIPAHPQEEQFPVLRKIFGRGK